MWSPNGSTRSGGDARRPLHNTALNRLANSVGIHAALACVILVLPASAWAQSCNFSPSSMSFGPAGGTQPLSWMAPANPLPGETCALTAANAASQSVGGCEAGGVVGGGCSCCSSYGNSSCVTLQGTYVDPVSGGTVTITTSGIGGHSCPDPSPSPTGIGLAGTSTNPQGTTAEPISTGTGNYLYQHTDLSFNDHVAGLPLIFQRS